MKKYVDNENYIQTCWDALSKNYNSSKRHYHNFDHLQNMIIESKEVEPFIQNLDAIYFSIFYHDVIYKPSRSDNELQSAEFFNEYISKTSFEDINLCFAQILATKSHKRRANMDTNILLDLDMAILGSPREDYKLYAQRIRKEYYIYPNIIYKKGRVKVLKQMLEPSSIYHHEYFIDKYEAKARENINYELKELLT